MSFVINKKNSFFVGAGIGQSIQTFGGESAMPTFAANTAKFNGSSQYLKVADNISLDLDDGDKTHILWFKTSSGSTQQLINKAPTGDNDYWDIYMNASGQIFARAQESLTKRHEYKTDASYNDGSLHMLAVDWNSYGTPIIYIDGASVDITISSSSGVPTVINSTYDLNIGARSSSSSQYFNGDISFVQIYASLSSESILSKYNDGEPLCYNDEDKTDMAHFWPLANWTNFESQELLDMHMSDNLTDVGTIPFTGTLTVACTALETFFATYDTTNAGSASDTIILPFTSDQNLSIDWGDGGATEDITTSAAATHTYSTGGIYNIRIVETAGGKVKFLKFNNGGDKAKLLDISSWDALDFGITGASVFFGCLNMDISATNFPKTDLMITANRMFTACSSLTRIPLIDMSLVADGTNFLKDCTNLASVPLFNLSSLVNGLSFVQACSLITSLPAFNLPSMTNGQQFANACTNLTTLGFTSLPAMTNGANMFLNVTLDTADTDALLVGTEATNSDLDCVWSLGNSKYTATGETALNALVARSPGWTIASGGLE